MQAALPGVAICVPARNEAGSLAATLAALASLDRDDRWLVVCVYLDSCTDGSEHVMVDAGVNFPWPLRVARGEQMQPNAGVARAAAMALGLEEVGDGPDALLLSTDADSRPRRDWLQAATRALAESDVAVGRIVRVGGENDRQARLEHYLDRLHAFRRMVDPVPWEVSNGTHHGGGANLAIRAGAYRALGGFRPLAAGEDAQLLDDAARAGLRVRRDPAMVVETSSRRVGRAPGGLADSLRMLDIEGLPRVQHPAAAVWQYERHAAARAAWDVLTPRACEAVGALIGVSGDHVLGVARDCANAEAFATRLIPAAPNAGRLVSLPEAERALDAIERGLCRGAA